MSYFTASNLILFFLLLVQNSLSKKLDVQKALDQHTTCNGDTVIVPPDMVTQGLLAGTKCLDISDEYCAKLCVGYNYDGLIKDNKFDTKFAKQLWKRIDFGKNEKAKEIMLASIDECTKNAGVFEKPDASTESCPELKKIDDCAEEKFAIACKGKKPTASDDFLD